MNSKSHLAILLAAGKGSRMYSKKPKVLHRVGGLALLGHVIKAVKGAGFERIAVVLNPQQGEIAEFCKSTDPQITTCIQDDPCGNANAVTTALELIRQTSGGVLVLNADVPLIRSRTLERLIQSIEDGVAVAVAGFKTQNPSGYGRLICEAEQVLAIREEKDATVQEKAITLCNAGALAFEAQALTRLLPQIKNENAKGEYYITDAIELAHSENLVTRALVIDETETQGINTRLELSAVEARFQAQKRTEHLEKGVTLIDPDTVFFSYDTEIAADVLIEPNVFFAPGVTIEKQVTIKAFCHIEGAFIASGSIIGPFARLRPGTRIGENAKVGNFCEIKKATLETGAKVNHLSYIGDAEIGADTNIGAGTITCNYDGVNKHQTIIQENAFIGSNTALVAPVTIGKGSVVAAGSTITRDVNAQSLAFGRARQVEKPKKTMPKD